MKRGIHVTNYFCVAHDTLTNNRTNPNWCCTTSEGVVRHKNNLFSKYTLSKGDSAKSLKSM
jgi:hypothetical protein